LVDKRVLALRQTVFSQVIAISADCSHGALRLCKVVAVAHDPDVIDFITLADVRTLLDHLPKGTRARDIWQHVEAKLNKAAAGRDTAQVSIALQMVLTLESVEYRLK
jgi:hypothetical protein